MSYQNLRIGRVSEPNRAYFVTSVTKHRTPLFDDLYRARAVINVMAKIQDAGQVTSLAWVVMPDHVHWLFQLTASSDLSSVMKGFKAQSAIKLNSMMNRRGSVWQPSFYDRGIRDDEDIRKIARYMVANPLRAGLVKEIGEYSHWDAVWL